MKPKPVVTETICSECGLDWERHGDNPTSSVCIRLLKADLAARPKPVTWTYPYYPGVYTPNTFPLYPSYTPHYGIVTNDCETSISNTATLTTTASDEAVTYTYKTPAINYVACYATSN